MCLRKHIPMERREMKVKMLNRLSVVLLLLMASLSIWGCRLNQRGGCFTFLTMSSKDCIASQSGLLGNPPSWIMALQLVFLSLTLIFHIPLSSIIFFPCMMKNCQMNPLLCLIPGSFVHLLFLLVLATGIPLSKRTAKVHLSYHGSLSHELKAGPCLKT